MTLKNTNAEFMKLAVMMQQRFGNGAQICVTECGRYSSDVLVLTKDDELVEYETKISLTDFKADFKKPKHQIYEHVQRVDEWNKKYEFVPHRFYFVVPEAIVADVLAKLMGKPYGVIAVPDEHIFQPSTMWIEGKKYLRVVKRASAIRKHNVTSAEKTVMLKRLTSELINEKINKIKTRKVINEKISDEDLEES